MHRLTRIVIVLAAVGLAGGVTVAAPAEAQLVSTECECNVPTSSTTSTVAPTTMSTGPLPSVDECVRLAGGTLICVRFHDDTRNPTPYVRVCVAPHFTTSTTCVSVYPDDGPFLDDAFGTPLPSACLDDGFPQPLMCVNGGGYGHRCAAWVIGAGFVCAQEA